MSGVVLWGSQLKLGFNTSERTVSRWVKRSSRAPDPARWRLAFRKNHRESIATMDFFTLPTLTFGVLHCFCAVRPRPTADSLLQRIPPSPDPCEERLKAVVPLAETGRS